jgi:hypothetical protein
MELSGGWKLYYYKRLQRQSLIEDIREISRADRVSSSQLRELDDKVYAELSSGYHNLLRLLGKVRTLNTCLVLTNASLSSLLNSESTDENTVIIDSGTAPLYPSSISDGEKAERDTEFGVITAKKVNSRLVFTDDAGIMKPTVRVVRATDNALFLEKPDYVVENAVEHCLEGDEPYLASFTKDSMSRSNITLEMRSTDQPFLINAIKYIPMPMAGSVMLEKLRYDGINPVVLNGGLEFEETSIYNTARTFPGYIHFEPVETSLIKMAVSSELYISTLGSVTVGVSKIVGEYHTFAKTSYIGYKVEFPTGTTKLTKVKMEKDSYALSLSNVIIKVYNSADDFNAVSNHYIVSCGVEQEVSVPDPGGSLYFLIEIESVNNTTPCLGKIELEYS